MSSGVTHADNILKVFRGTTAYAVRTSMYLSLHTGDPAATGANEATYSKYARSKLTKGTWGAPTGTAGTNRRIEYGAKVTLSTVGTTTAGQKAIYLGIWDHATQTSASHFFVGGALNTSVTLNSNVVPSFATSAIDIQQN